MKEKEAAESAAGKNANSLEKQLKQGQQGVKDSQNAIKKAKKRLDKAINKVLEDLDIDEIRDLEVGSPLNKFISGGQRKRLNIALELLMTDSYSMHNIFVENLFNSSASDKSTFFALALSNNSAYRSEYSGVIT